MLLFALTWTTIGLVLTVARAATFLIRGRVHAALAAAVIAGVLMLAVTGAATLIDGICQPPMDCTVMAAP